MIRTEPDYLWREIQAAISKRDEFLARENEMIRRYHGPAYRQGGNVQGFPDGGWADYANHSFENTALSASKTIHNNPRVTITGYADQNSKKEAHYLEQGANADLRRTNIRRQMQNTWPDFQMYWFITCTTSEPREHEEEEENPVHTPTTKVIDRRDFFIDVYAKTFEEARLMGHRNVIDKEDLIQLAKDDPDAGWNLDAIDGLMKDSNLGREYDTERNEKLSITRDEVSYWEVYIKRTKEEMPEDALADEAAARKSGDKLYNGWIYTFAETTQGDSKAIAIRDPRPFFGAPGGPYDLHGCYTVSREVWPLGPLTATYHQQRALNEHIDRMLRHSKKARTIVASDGFNTDDNEKLKNAEDGDWVVVSGFDKSKTQDFKFDGLTEQDGAIYNFLKDLLEQGSGTYAASVGKVTGIGTATENAIAGEGANARQEFVAQRHTDGWQSVIKKRVWYLRNDFRIHFRLEDGSLYFGGYDLEKAVTYAAERKSITQDEADQILQAVAMTKKLKLVMAAQQAQQTGVKTAPDLDSMGNGHTPWHELDIEIDVYSIQRTSEALQQQRLTEGSQLLIGMIPLMLGNPQVDWPTLLTKLGDSLNWPDLGDILKEQILQGLYQAQAQAADAAQQQQAQMSQGAPPRAPRVPQSGGGGQPPGPGPMKSPGLPGNASGAAAAKSAGVGR